MIVLDTHALIWTFEGDPRLGTSSRRAIDAAVQADGVGFSAITLWEISMLTAKGRLALTRDVEDWIAFVVEAEGTRLLPLEPAIAIACNRLPGNFHSDPADRIIVATARNLGAPLMTADRKILDYAGGGHLRTIDAGR